MQFPELTGLPELVGDAAERVETGLQFAYVSDHYLPDEPVQVPVHDPLGVADSLGHLT